MTRAEALAGISSISLAGLTACGTDLRGIIATKGSALRPTMFGCQIYPSDDVAKTVPLLAACGSTVLRVTADDSSFAFFDAVFAAAAQYGMRVIVISQYAPQPVDLNVYAASTVRFHNRYAAYSPIWELWNEPNLAYYWGAPPDRAAYAALAIATGTALRNAGAREILSGGISGIDVGWLHDLRVLGVFDVVTGCAVHSYENPNFALNQYLQALTVLPPGIGIYTTETCVVTSSGQPSFFRDMWYLHRDLSLPMMVWCEFRDGTAGPRPPYTDPMGLVTGGYIPKPVYYTAESLTRAT